MNFINVDVVAVSAMETLRHIITDQSTSIFTLGDLVLPALEAMLVKLKCTIEKTGHQTDYAIELLHLLSAIHIRYPHTQTLVRPTSLDFILEPIIEAAANQRPFSAYSASGQQLTMYVRCVHVLVTVSRFDKDAVDVWQTKLKQLFSNVHIQHIFARACWINEGNCVYHIFKNLKHMFIQK